MTMTEQTKNLPHKIWSPVSRFIFLPWILVFLVIFYWFSFVPLLFAYYIKVSHPPSVSKCIFLAILLLIFILMLGILIYVWKRPPKECKNVSKDFCTITKLERDLEACEDCLDTPEVADKRSMLTLDLGNRNCENTEDICLRSRRPNDDGRPLSQNLEVALTPRELFFRDLYESVHETDSSITRDFIQRERQYSSLGSYVSSAASSRSWELLAKSSVSKINGNCPEDTDVETGMDGTGEVSEFFVANVSEKPNVTSEVFLYVSGESEKQNKISRIVSIHSEDDDVFQK